MMLARLLIHTAGKGMGMESIRQKLWLYGVLAGIGLVSGVLALVCSPMAHVVWARMILAVALVASVLAAGLWIREYKRLELARLIIENQILHIRPAVITDGTGATARPGDAQAMEVYVSYFGILLDSRIIKYNQEGILLLGVEIGPDSISLTYGTGKWVQTVRLLHAALSGGELGRIVDRFRFEAGVTPVVTSSPAGGAEATKGSSPML
jgi:hypothetical protein